MIKWRGLERYGELMDLERLQNEVVFDKMQKPKIKTHIPLITLVSVILTSDIIVSWTLLIV